ncbi:MAG: peptidase M1 [Flavobacteriaceae bacterium]|nr:peptidase M1 [Flavobacteriaceae bacterium]
MNNKLKIKFNYVFCLVYFFCYSLNIVAQNYTLQDTLRGSITDERIWWDLTYYELEVSVNPGSKSIFGKNTIYYKVLDERNKMQIDLQSPMQLTKATQSGKSLRISRKGNVYYIHLQEKGKKNNINNITVYFDGVPKEAVKAPWDGGFSWNKDVNGKDFIATSCQGIGASVWWPNKDHMYDEVDSMQISINVPKPLKAISNGRLKEISESKNRTSYTWFVSNPINNYGVNINIGNYVNFSEKYQGEKGILDMDYYVLKHNLEKAKKQFLDAPKMMKAFEYWFGPYPFYEDSYKLVEVPYLGMEHQSSITYGNKYKKGYLGQDLSGTGWGLLFDFIIIHESGHEWFANNITNKDIADMWIHEGFTTHAESLFIDYYYGKKASAEYVIGTRKRIQNEYPIIGDYNVNKEGSSDMYYKGANIIHMIRQICKGDEKWRQILRKMNTKFYHMTVSTKQIEDFISSEIGWNLEPFFDQYLRDIRIPVLEYQIKDDSMIYRWINVINSFNMPIEITDGDSKRWLYPTNSWKKTSVNSSKIVIDLDYYIDSKKL